MLNITRKVKYQMILFLCQIKSPQNMMQIADALSRIFIKRSFFIFCKFKENEAKD